MSGLLGAPADGPAAGVDSPYHLLEPLPRALWLPAVINSVGTPPSRLAALTEWRCALAAGELPDGAHDFGDAAALGSLRAVIGELALPSLCRAAPAISEQVLRTMLWHLDRLIDRPAGQPRATAIAAMAQDFRDEWTVERGSWEQVLQLLQDLGDLAQLRWDEIQGLLRSRDWQEAQRLAALMAQRPDLAALIRRLGREQRAVDPLPPAPAPPEPAAGRPLGLRAVETRLPDAPGEVRGIRLSGHLDRMLGSEALQIRHPVLRKLWRARRAEARLLTYDSEAVLVDWRADPNAPPREAAVPPKPQLLERGPIILALDTSGSMRGAPELIAKAIVLETMRIAHRERRGCRLVAFGGPGELVEHDLSFDRGGLAALLGFIGQGFDGGTDVQAPIEAAIECVHQARWASADLMIVSDGEFGCTSATLDRLDDARQRFGLRVQGVLVGDRETMGLMEVSDDIFWVRDWRRDGPTATGASFSPVHSKSLTALFFPNALSGRAARHRRS